MHTNRHLCDTETGSPPQPIYCVRERQGGEGGGREREREREREERERERERERAHLSMAQGHRQRHPPSCSTCVFLARS